MKFNNNNFFLSGNSNLLRDSAIDTADFILFHDKLFDSVNGSKIKGDPGKPLRSAIKGDGRLHIGFWNEAIKVLKTTRFITTDLDGNEKEFVPPTVKNWIRTLNGFKALWDNLRKAGFRFFGLRSCNQDPVENFFNGIRMCGVRNVNPTCTG